MCDAEVYLWRALSLRLLVLDALLVPLTTGSTVGIPSYGLLLSGGGLLLIGSSFDRWLCYERFGQGLMDVPWRRNRYAGQ